MRSLYLLELQELTCDCYWFALMPQNLSNIIHVLHFSHCSFYIWLLWFMLSFLFSLLLQSIKPHVLYTTASAESILLKNKWFLSCCRSNFFARWQKVDGAPIPPDGRTPGSVLKACICAISQNPDPQIQSACTSGYNHILNIGYAIICL